MAKNDFAGLIDLFSPRPLAEFLGLAYEEVDVIPSPDRSVVTAGTLDRRKKLIQISLRFPAEQRRLTGMHELMHWMLKHDLGKEVLHRDRSLVHQTERNNVKFIEWEATHVACQYLMPEKLVKTMFAALLHLNYGEPVCLDANVAFHLNKAESELRKLNQRQKSLLFATTKFYGVSVIPLHEFFKVSPTAMAIRLEDLELIGSNVHRGKPLLRIV